MATTTSSVFGYGGTSRPEFNGKTVQERQKEKELRDAAIASEAAALGVVTPDHANLQESYKNLEKNVSLLEAKASAVRDFLDGNLTKKELATVIDGLTDVPNNV